MGLTPSSNQGAVVEPQGHLLMENVLDRLTPPNGPELSKPRVFRLIDASIRPYNELPRSKLTRYQNNTNWSE